MSPLRRLALAAALALAAGPAAALSCVYLTAQDVFRQHDAAPETYVAVFGAFTRVEKVRHDRKQDRVLWHATFEGFSASSRAFDRPFAAEVDIVQPLWTGLDGGSGDPDALGQWLPGEKGIVYLERRADGYHASVDLCRSLVDTEAANVRPTLDCLAGRRCKGSN